MVLSIGLLALLGAFTSGVVTITRASRASTASSLASAQLELYRALTYPTIALDSTAVGSTDSVYRNDSALPGSNISNDITTTTGCSGLPNQCNPSRTVTGPDHGSYRIDTYIVSDTPSGGHAVKLVTVVVRNGSSPSSVPYVRRVSAFDTSTG